jgi:hypothetical protein
VKFGGVTATGLDTSGAPTSIVAHVPAHAVAGKVTATGPAGTVIFCDTSGFHCGGSARTKPRVLSYHTYVSPASKKPARFRVDLPADGNGMPESAQVALTRALKRQ